MAIEKYKTKDGKTRYQARIYYKRKRLASKTFESKQVAKTWERQQLVELESTGVLTDKVEASETTLAEMAIKYRDTVSIQKRGFHSEKGKLKNIANSKLANKALAHITSKDIAKYRDDLSKSGYAPSTVKQYLALLSHIYTKIITEWEIATVTNVVKGVKRPVVNNARERRLIDDEQDILLSNAGKQYDLRNAIIIALETGMRQGEIAALTWSDIDLKKCHIYVRKSKSGFSRTVRLSKDAVNVFNSMKLNNSKEVFVTKAGDISRAFTRLVRMLGIDNLRFHDLRHEATSRFFEKGLNIKQVQQMTGHETLEMLFRYVHLSPDNDFVDMLG